MPRSFYRDLSAIPPLIHPHLQLLFTTKQQLNQLPYPRLRILLHPLPLPKVRQLLRPRLYPQHRPQRLLLSQDLRIPLLPAPTTARRIIPARMLPRILAFSCQQNQANLSGYVTINPPLEGSGSILNGFVQNNNYIHFTVQGYGGNAPLFFTGTVAQNGSMQGQYCSIDNTGHCNSSSGGHGTWNLNPGNSGTSFIVPDKRVTIPTA